MQISSIQHAPVQFGEWQPGGTRLFHFRVGRHAEVWGTQFAGGGVHKEIVVGGLSLTAAEGRRLAADLLDAAAEVEAEELLEGPHQQPV